MKQCKIITKTSFVGVFFFVCLFLIGCVDALVISYENQSYLLSALKTYNSFLVFLKNKTLRS